MWKKGHLKGGWAIQLPTDANFGDDLASHAPAIFLRNAFL